MVVSETQLQTWSRPGAVTTSINAHESIRKVLLSENSPIKGKQMEFFLQGSYKNDTNIRGDSDVDVVIQLNEPYYSDTSSLPYDQLNLYNATHNNATYNYWNFRADVLKTLTDYYGTKVKAGNKSIKLAGDSSRVNADVVPCVQFRKYKRFFSLDNEDYAEGMLFFTQSEQRQIINYPKLHYSNGCKKNSPDGTSGWFKSTVRIFKNARSKLVDDMKMTVSMAPSYLIECLTYNVPNDRFGKSWQDNYYNVLDWLAQADFTNFICQNGQTLLFGNSPEQWNMQYAKTFVNQLLKIE
jgi:hypothetical protein